MLHVLEALSVTITLSLVFADIIKGLLDVSDFVQCLMELAQGHTMNLCTHKWIAIFHLAPVEAPFQASFLHGAPLCPAGLGTETAQRPFGTFLQ